MKIGKFEIGQRELVIAVSAAVVFIALGSYLILFAPLLTKIKAKYLECRSVEQGVAACRNIINSAGDVYGAKVLMTEKSVHRAIDELTRHGRAKGINFISIKPQTVTSAKNPRYKILPVSIMVESNYAELGIFLGSLDELEKSLVKVKSFDIKPDSDDPSKFLTDVALDIYLSGREDEG